MRFDLKNTFIVFIMCSLAAINCVAQDANILFGGTIKEDRSRLEGVTIELQEDGRQKKKIVTSSNGKFEFILEYEHVYLITVSKPGYVSKRIKVDARNIPAEAGKYGFGYDQIEVAIFKEMKGLDVSILDKPIGIIYYNADIENLDFDKEYTASIKEKLDQMMAELERRKKEEEERLKQLEKDYRDALSEGDKALRKQEYKEAKTYYEKAASLKPDEQLPKDKIKEIDKKLAEIAAKDKNYNDAIAKGDKAFDAANYEEAITAYQKASQLKPSESYPKDRQEEAKEKLGNIKKYESTIARADQAFSSKKYEDAKGIYEEALGYKPNETYPKTKIDEIAKILKALEEKEKKEAEKQKQYDQLISDADGEFGNQAYEKAKGLYKQAQGVFPNESYPKEKISEIDKILADQKAKEAEYKKLIASADKALGAKDYEMAKTDYNAALGVKPDEQYPKDKIAEIDDLLKNKAQKEKEYKDLIADADKKFGSQDYENAKTGYQSALKIKPNEQYPKGKIAEIDKKLKELAKDKELQEKYDKLIAEGDSKLSDKDYTGAKTAFQSASGLKPGEQYPKDKIAEIEKLLKELANKEAAEKAKEAEYKKLIASADKALGAKDYEKAKTDYNAALGVKPDEKYPKDKIKEINDMLKELADKEAAEKAREEEYNGLIASADAKFDKKDYRGAKVDYENALGVKPGEKYPTGRIEEIDKILKDLKKNQAAEEQYNNLITDADKAFGGKDYENAKNYYNEALGIKPGEKYPKDKIAEIDDILKDLAAKEAAEKAKEQQYNDLIAKADKALNNKEYEPAKKDYQAALEIKPSEKYPRDKIAEIDAALAELARKEKDQAARDRAYNEAIAAGDKAFGAEDYKEAKGQFEEALRMKPEESYPKEKISEIDDILASLSDAREKEKQYNEMIAKADKAFDAKKYDDAKSAYQSALKYKDEDYPKQKIKEIENILGNLADAEAAEKAKREKYEKLIADGDAGFSSENYERAKEKYQSALDLYSNEAYPAKKIKEIDKILVEQSMNEAARKKAEEERKARQEKYDALIQKADDAFGGENYTVAKSNYEAALAVLPDESYPKDKLAEIEKILEEIRRKEEEAKKNAESEKERKRRYSRIITRADFLFKTKDYTGAISKYEEAGAILPDEEYPPQQIQAIQDILEKQKKESQEKEALEEQYKNLVAQADDKFIATEYEQAADYYTQALDLKPNEYYPKSQLNKIKTKLSLLESQQKAEEERLKKLEEMKRKQELIDAQKEKEKEEVKELAPEDEEGEPNELATKYPQGVTEETYRDGNKVITVRIVVRGNQGNEYKRVVTTYGTYYFKNGDSITILTWNKETKE